MGAIPPGCDFMMASILLILVVSGLTLYLTAVILYPEKF
jgi:K+-transporting ATPase KdpF subunit